MALRFLDLFTHASRRQPSIVSAGRKDSRAMALDASQRMGTIGYSLTGPKLKDYESYLRAYKSVAWCRACVQVISYNCANIDFRLVKPVSGAGGNDNEDEEVLDSPFLDLLTNPNPYQTGFELREAIWTDLELTGNAYLELAAPSPRGLPTEMYRLNPSRMTVLPDRSKFIRGYRYVVNGRAVDPDYTPEEIIHLKYPNPMDDFYGMGTIEAGEGRFESEMAMVTHERNFWLSGAKMQGIFETTETLDDSTWTRLTDRMRAFFQGSGYSTMIAENGLTYKSVTDSPAKLGMLEMQLASRDQIFAMFGVPPTKLGILERANYKADEADRFFWSETVGPKLTRVEDSIQNLVDLFHPGQNLKLRFKRVDFTDDVPQMTVAKLMSEVGVYTADEIRAYTGRDPLPDDRGDLVMALVTTVPLDMGGPMSTVNERRVDQGLTPLEGGDSTLILPRGAVPLDVKNEAIEPRFPIEGAPVNGAPGGTGTPSNVVQMRQPPATQPAAASGKAVQRVSLRAPATAHLVQQHRTKALEASLAVYQPKLEEFFAAQETRVLGRLASFPKRQKSALADAPWWDDGEDAALGEVLTPLWTDALTAGVAAAHAVGIPARGETPARIDQMRQDMSQRITGINQTTRSVISDQIAEGLRRGYSSAQIATGVEAESYPGVSGAFASAKGYRSEMIARTELSQAYLRANLDTYQQSGVVKMVEAQDGTRDAFCANRNGEIMTVDEAMMIADHPNGTLNWVPLVE